MSSSRTRTARAPVLVPAPQGWAGRANVRALRIRVAADGALVVERPDGAVERRAAPGEVTRVVLLPDVTEAGLPPSEYGAGAGSADAHGLLVALAGDRPVLAVRLAEWVPSPAELDGRAARAASGANALAAALGRAVEPGDAAALRARAGEVRAVLVSPRATLPAAHRALLAAGGVAVAAWFVASAVGRYAHDPRHRAFGWAGALGALLLTATWLALRRRAFRPLPPPPGTEIAPRPATAAPEVFLRTRLYASPEWLVLADGVGREAWLPGPALGGVTAAAVTTEAFVLDDADGNGLAALPRDAWCGASGADAALRSALSAAGLVVRDEPSSRAPGAWLAAPHPMGALDDPMYTRLREARGVPALAGIAGGAAGGMVALGALGLGEPVTALAASLPAAAAVATWAADLARARRARRTR